ncbi:uncharacterized protein LOC114333563 [Diabrotica virgifera virgifera]|uniref:Uncharacterized protein LOC114333563 n=1 Tax=Diabrotica virgifera virgifera TaxID=50390 RepID=A0A6P7G3V7_DIAVI|nr:uncharacterized protein LOC114333563 [Diabrotica virgifera virgifera]
MKVLLLLAIFVPFVVSHDAKITELLSKEILRDVDVELLLTQMETIYLFEKNSAGNITAVLNEFLDKVLENMENFIINHGYDPMQIPDTALNLPITGSITLKKGWLRDLAMIKRYKDTGVVYSSEEKKLKMIFSLQFEELQFVYHYITQYLLLRIEGEVEGKIEDVIIQAALSFDFHTYNATLDNFDIMNTGSIDIEFSGNGLIDWLTNAMTGVVTAFLHPLILSIIQNIFKGTLGSLVDAVNEIIHEILHLN